MSLLPRLHSVGRFSAALAFAALLATAVTVQAQSPTPPGIGQACTVLDQDSGGQQSAVALGQKQLSARATGSAGVERSSFAEATYRIESPIAFPATLRLGVTFNGILRGFGGGNINFGRVRITAELRNVTTDETVASTTLFDKTEKGKAGQSIIQVVTSNPFNPTGGEFQHLLQAGVEYAVSVRLTTNASGINARSDFFTDLRGATFTCLQIIPDWEDTDGDGIYDIWETSGIDIDGDGENELDISQLGVDHAGRAITLDPNRKDILVEMDWFDCAVAGSDCPAGDIHSHDPATSVAPDNPLDPVVAAFDAAPVSNPNGAADGIALWLQLDEALPHQAACDLSDGCFDEVKAGAFGTAAEKGNAGLLAAKALIFRYGLWLHDKNPGNTSSGEADGHAGVSGDDFVISLGSWSGQVGTFEDQAGTLMHELGHTLALGHGGVDNKNCKPNHLSVMSYLYQTQGLQPSGTFDYSRSLLPDTGVLKEDDLDETIGVQDGAFDILFGPPDSSGSLQVGSGLGAIDWDADGDPSETSVQADINYAGLADCIGDGSPDAEPDDELPGALDWDLLQYNFRDSPFFPAGEHGEQLVPELDRDSAERIKNMTWGGQNQVYFEYAAKFICGIQNERETRFAPGRYATVINIRNPNRDPVRFRKRLSVAFPPAEQQPGPVLPISIDTLAHEEALKVDCPDVETNVFDGDFGSAMIDGFVVIQSPALLDVQAVYTSAGPGELGGSSIDVEAQVARRIDLRKPNLRPLPGLPTPEEVNLPEGFPGVLFCVPNPDGGTPDRIRVLIRNLGPVAAEASTARAQFGNAGSVNAPIAAVPAHGEQEVEFDIPRGCFGPGFGSSCSFEVVADAPDLIDESAEGDNTTAGFCVSPAG